MFGIGPMEMVIVGIIALLLFGKRLPEVAKGLGKSIVEFKKGMQGIEEDIRDSGSKPVSSTPAARPSTADDREEPAAPRFDPPRYEEANRS
jgi:sec-independent protein translocase protein TatA